MEHVKRMYINSLIYFSMVVSIVYIQCLPPTSNGMCTKTEYSVPKNVPKELHSVRILESFQQGVQCAKSLSEHFRFAL